MLVKFYINGKGVRKEVNTFRCTQKAVDELKACLGGMERVDA